MTLPPAEAQELKSLIESVTGIKWDELTDDSERRVTFFEVSMKRDVVESQYRKTGEKKYLEQAVRAGCLLNEMGSKLSEGKSLYLKPSELSSLLSPPHP